MGAGPARMNRVLVRIVASAVAERLLRDPHPGGAVIVGYDARHGSRDFATDTARVLAHRGIRVTMLPEPMPTPVLAFAVKHLEAAAGVMVTASHNPRPDNGYKVYWRGGSLLAAPVDREISAIIDGTAPLSPGDLSAADDPRIVTVADEVIKAYLDAVVGLLSPRGPRSVRMAYTPLHGVGADTFLRAVAGAGFDAPQLVADQAEPDPEFPTAPFPNPEEPGTLDGLLRLAARMDADVAVAHDPDADRLAVAVPAGDRWRLLTGDETGCLLAEHLLTRPHPTEDHDPGDETDPDRSTDPDREADQDAPRRRLVINTVVSSRLLARIAAAHQAEWAETLTGFKWIMKARSQRPDHDLVLGYEDALGYAVGEAVGDKDGIGAALAMAELVAHLKTEGRTLLDLLDDLHRCHGAHATGQRSIRFEPTSRQEQPMARAMAGLRTTPPTELAGAAVTAAHDLSGGSPHLPPADLVVLELGDAAARVCVRPSGTEPKMKIYAEAVVAIDDPDNTSQLRSAQAEAQETVATLLDATARHATAPD